MSAAEGNVGGENGFRMNQRRPAGNAEGESGPSPFTGPVVNIDGEHVQLGLLEKTKGLHMLLDGKFRSARRCQNDGHCKYGNNCTYVHFRIVAVNREAIPVSYLEDTVGLRNLLSNRYRGGRRCKWNAMGRVCRLGPLCPYVHLAADENGYIPLDKQYAQEWQQRYDQAKQQAERANGEGEGSNAYNVGATAFYPSWHNQATDAQLGQAVTVSVTEKRTSPVNSVAPTPSEVRANSKAHKTGAPASTAAAPIAITPAMFLEMDEAELDFRSDELLDEASTRAADYYGVSEADLDGTTLYYSFSDDEALLFQVHTAIMRMMYGIVPGSGILPYNTAQDDVWAESYVENKDVAARYISVSSTLYRGDVATAYGSKMSHAALHHHVAHLFRKHFTDSRHWATSDVVDGVIELARKYGLTSLAAPARDSDSPSKGTDSRGTSPVHRSGSSERNSSVAVASDVSGLPPGTKVPTPHTLQMCFETGSAVLAMLFRSSFAPKSRPDTIMTVIDPVPTELATPTSAGGPSITLMSLRHEGFVALQLELRDTLLRYLVEARSGGQRSATTCAVLAGQSTRSSGGSAAASPPWSSMFRSASMGSSTEGMTTPAASVGIALRMMKLAIDCGAEGAASIATGAAAS